MLNYFRGARPAPPKALGLTKSGKVTPAVDFKHLEEVLVITKLKETGEEAEITAPKAEEEASGDAKKQKQDDDATTEE